MIDKMTVLSEFDKKAIEAADAINSSIEEKAVDKIGVEFDAETGYKFSLCNGVYSSQNFLSLLAFVQRLGTVFKDSENLENFQIRSFQINEKYHSVFRSPFTLFNGIAQVVDSNNRVVSIYFVKNGVRSCDGMEGGVHFENEKESFPLYSRDDRVFKSQELYTYYKESKNEILTLMQSLTNRVEFLEHDGGGYIEKIVVSNEDWTLTMDSFANEKCEAEAKVNLPISIVNNNTGISCFFKDPKEAFSNFRKFSLESRQLKNKTNKEWNRLICLNLPLYDVHNEKQKNGCFYNKNGDSFVFVKDGNLHRQDGPAVVRFGSEQYWLYGKAIGVELWTEFADKLKKLIVKHGDFKVDNKKIKFIIYRDKFATVDNRFAIKYFNENGLLHREDGPAVIEDNGEEHYFLKGKLYSKEEFEKVKKLSWVKEHLPKDENGNLLPYKEMLIHETVPVNYTGSIVWLSIDKQEAISIGFYKNGKLHNEKSYAVIRADKQNYYYFDGVPCTEHNWKQKVEEMNKNIFNSKKKLLDLQKEAEVKKLIEKSQGVAELVAEYYAKKSAIAPGELKALNYQEVPVKELRDIVTNISNFSGYYQRLAADGKITREDAEKSTLNEYVMQLIKRAHEHHSEPKIITWEQYNRIADLKEIGNCLVVVVDENGKIGQLSIHDSNGDCHNDKGHAYVNLNSKQIGYYELGKLIRNEEVIGLVVKGTLCKTPKPSHIETPVKTLGDIESDISNFLKNHAEKIRTLGSVTLEKMQEFDLNIGLLRLIQDAKEKKVNVRIVTTEEYYGIDNAHLKDSLLVVIDSNRKVNWAALYDSNGNCHNEDGPAYVDLQIKTVSYFLGGAIIYDVENFKKYVEDYRTTDFMSFRQKMDNASSKKQIVVADEVRESVMRGLIKQIKRMLVETVADQLANHMPDQIKAKKVAVEMLKTPTGSALFSLAIGSAVPVVAEKFPVEYKKYIEETGKELRVSGGADIVYELSGVVGDVTSGLVLGIKSSFEQLKAHDSRKNNIPVRVEVAKGPIVPAVAPENADNVCVESNVVQGRKSF
jgi:hypothetical protein